MAHNNEMPTVLHVSTAATWRGGEQQLAYLYEELEQLNVSQIIACAKGSAMEKYCVDKGHEHWAVKKGSSVDPGFARQIKQLSRSMEVDLIHTHDSHGHSLAIIAATLFRNPVPIVVSRRVDFPIKNSSFSRFKYNHHRVQKIICVSNAIQAITASGIRDKSILTTVHSGIDTSKFSMAASGKLRKEFQIPSNTLLIGNVAALAPHKDYFTFLHAVKELTMEGINAKFLAIGDGPLKEEIYDYCAKLNLQEHVIFTGFRKDVPEILPELDLFLITSETEGLGTSILDAIACKVPVVATAAGGIPEIIEHERTGMLAKVKDAATLAKWVQQVVQSPELRQTIVNGATQKLQQFTKAATAQKTLAVYEEVLS